MQPRRNAERDAAQPIAGQPRDDEEQLQDAEAVPSFLTARELQARGTGKPAPAPEPEEKKPATRKTQRP